MRFASLSERIRLPRLLANLRKFLPQLERMIVSSWPEFWFRMDLTYH
jgi:hypothetical protein